MLNIGNHQERQIKTTGYHLTRVSIAIIKKVGRMAEVAEHLLSKCEALSSNPSTGKKKKDNKR
jgi:hypothetical protein